MASLNTHSAGKKSGSKYIMFNRGGKRRMIYLGKIRERVAEKILGHVEDLIAASMGGVAVSPATSHWLTTIDEGLAGKLLKVGLIDQLPNGGSDALATLDA